MKIILFSFVTLLSKLLILSNSFTSSFVIKDGIPNTGIIGGYKAIRGQFPFIVSLQIDGKHFCGAVLVSDKHLLTAAHCKPKPPRDVFQIDALFGALNLNASSFEEKQRKTIRVRDRHWHPKFSFSCGLFDIAVLELDKPIEFDENINKIKLASESSEFLEIGTSVISAGFGVDSFNITNLDPDIRKLKYAYFEIVEPKECELSYAQDTGISSICVRTNTTNSVAWGDSGGPLIGMSSDKRVELLGIVSRGALNWQSSIFTKVSHYLDWIESITGPL